MAKQISKIKEPPTTSDPQNFDARADEFVACLPKFVTEANELAVEAENNANAAQSSKEAAANSAQLAEQARDAVALSAQNLAAAVNDAIECKQSAAKSANNAKKSETAVSEIKDGLADALDTLEAMKKISKDGFIDDGTQSETKTYSSKKIEADFAPKNENTSEQKIYGKPLSAAGEASSVVVRDSSGYISSTTPKSEEFTADHLVCVRGSDGKEKFVPLETIYKNALERILKENLSLRSYADIDIIESIAPLALSGVSIEAKRLKNKNIFAYSPSSWSKAAVFTPSLEEVELAPPPGGENSYDVIRLIDDDSSIFVVPLSSRKLFKLIETSDSCSWEEVVLDKAAPMPPTLNVIPNQCLNKFLYLKGSDGKIYKFDGRSATKTDIAGDASYISLDSARNSPWGMRGFSEDGCYYHISYGNTNKLPLKNLTPTWMGYSVPYGAVSDFENFALLLGRDSSNKAAPAIMDIKKNKTTTIPRSVKIDSGRASDYTDRFITQTFFLSSGEDIYILGDARAPLVKPDSPQRVIAKINKKMLAYYGIEIKE
nr:MAG TPA: hypothetical protein [Caudoviricetes sp.]